MAVRHLKILYLEDNPGDVFLLRQMLDQVELFDYELIHFDKLSDGVQYLDNNEIDIAIVDLGLPDSAGIPTFDEVFSSNKDLPIIVLSGITDESTAFELIQKGGQDYLSKAELSSVAIGRAILYAIERKENEILLKEAKKKAEEADELKSAFLANMSHDLRTPLNSIIGFTELIEDTEEVNKEVSNFLKIISRNSESLLQMVNDIIDISKIEAGQLDIDNASFDVNELLNELHFTYLEKTKVLKKDITLQLKHQATTTHQLFVHSDRFRLQQVLINLIDNAMKFTHQGTIEYGYVFQDENTLQFYIKDSGIGIPKESQRIIFERFGQIRNNDGTKRIEGTGLGLAISTQLINLMGGSIWVDSEVGKGATFHFTLPINQNLVSCSTPEPIKPKEVQAREVNWQKYSILVVEDIDTNFELIQSALRKTNVNLISANTGKAGLEISKTNPNIDLVLLDIRLPDIDGYQIAKEVKEFRPDLPIIAQTALTMAGEMKRCMEAGCDAYLSKPLKKEKLIQAISIYLK